MCFFRRVDIIVSGMMRVRSGSVVYFFHNDIRIMYDFDSFILYFYDFHYLCSLQRS